MLQEVTLVAVSFQGVVSKGPILMSALIGLTTLFSTLSVITRVKNGEMGLRTRRGKVILKNGRPINVYPGWHFRFFLWNIETVPVQTDPLVFGMQECVTKDGVTVNIQCGGVFRIAGVRRTVKFAADDPNPKAWWYGDMVRRFRYECNDVPGFVSIAYRGAIRYFVGNVTYDQLRTDSGEGVQRYVRMRTRDKLEEVGLQIAADTFEIVDLKPTDAQQNSSATLQVADAIRSLKAIIPVPSSNGNGHHNGQSAAHA